MKCLNHVRPFSLRLPAAKSAWRGLYAALAALAVFAFAAAPVHAQQVSSVTLTPSTGTSGQSFVVTINLDKAAPPFGGYMTVNLPWFPKPQVFLVAAGKTSAQLHANCPSVSATRQYTITASFGTGGISKSAILTVVPFGTPPPPQAVIVAGFTVSPAKIKGGLTAIGTVTLGQPAPWGGGWVPITYSNGHAYGPASVIVPAGATSYSFAIRTTPVGYGSYTTFIYAGGKYAMLVTVP